MGQKKNGRRKRMAEERKAYTDVKRCGPRLKKERNVYEYKHRKNVSKIATKNENTWVDESKSCWLDICSRGS